MSQAKTTDAEVIERLKALKKHGSIRKAGAALSLHHSVILGAQILAKARGLTADSKITDELAQTKTKLKIVTAELASVKKQNDTAQSIRESIYELSAITPAPPRWLTKKRPAGAPGVPMAMWSDWHWGEVVRAGEEIGRASWREIV